MVTVFRLNPSWSGHLRVIFGTGPFQNPAEPLSHSVLEPSHALVDPYSLGSDDSDSVGGPFTRANEKSQA